MNSSANVSHLRIVAPLPAQAAAIGASHAILIRVLDLMDYGVMLLAPTAQVCHANRAALRECGPNAAWRLVDGHLRPRDDRDQSRLLRALAMARSGRRNMLTFRDSDGPTTLAVLPVEDGLQTALDAPMLVLFGRRQPCEPISIELWARQHRLTGTETAVLRGALTGLRAPEIASDMGVAVSTIRSHLGSIRLKFGTRSIADVLRLMMLLPPITSVL